jgi:hypothetical protein
MACNMYKSSISHRIYHVKSNDGPALPGRRYDVLARQAPHICADVYKVNAMYTQARGKIRPVCGDTLVGIMQG